MAVATGAAIMAGTALASGAAQTIAGASGKKRARRMAERIAAQRQQLSNAYQSQRVSTQGADFQREVGERNMASAVDALRAGGTRGVAQVGGLVAANNDMNRQISADLDRQQVAIDQARAADDVRIQQMNEQFTMNQLGAAQGQMNAANQQMWSGFGEVGKGINLAAAYTDFDGKGSLMGG